MTKKIFSLACLVILAFPLVVSAQNNAPGGNGVATKITERVNEAVKGVIARCAVVESKIQSKTSVFDNSKVRHLEIYANIKNRLTSIMEKLSARGIDVTSLKASLTVFDQKIKKFSDDYAIYINKLKDSQVYVCGKAEGDFKNKLKEAKAALAQVHRDAVEIRTYYAKTLKPELNRLRNQLRPKSATTTPETSELETPTEPVSDDLEIN